MNRATTNSSVGILGLLGIVFIVLRLTGYISWPWMLVTAPLWAPVAITIVVLIGIFISLFMRNR